MSGGKRSIDDLSPAQLSSEVSRWKAGTNGAPKKGGGRTTKRESHRRFELLNWFVDAAMQECSAPEGLAWLVLYRHTRKGTVTISQRSIARHAGLSQRTVVNAIRGLVEKGFLVVITPGQKDRTPATYRLVVRPK